MVVLTANTALPAPLFQENTFTYPTWNPLDIRFFLLCSPGVGRFRWLYLKDLSFTCALLFWAATWVQATGIFSLDYCQRLTGLIVFTVPDPNPLLTRRLFSPCSEHQLLLATYRTPIILNMAEEGTRDGHLPHHPQHSSTGLQVSKWSRFSPAPGPGHTLCTLKHSTTLYTTTSNFFLISGPFSKSSPLS